MREYGESGALFRGVVVMLCPLSSGMGGRLCRYVYEGVCGALLAPFAPRVGVKGACMMLVVCAESGGAFMLGLSGALLCDCDGVNGADVLVNMDVLSVSGGLCACPESPAMRALVAANDKTVGVARGLRGAIVGGLMGLGIPAEVLLFLLLLLFIPTELLLGTDKDFDALVRGMTSDRLAEELCARNEGDVLMPEPAAACTIGDLGVLSTNGAMLGVCLFTDGDAGVEVDAVFGTADVTDWLLV